MFSAVTLGIGFGLFMAISVGPTIFAILKYSISYGYKAGLSYVLGVSISDTMYVILANLASGLLTSATHHEKLIGTIGSLIFIVMGVYGYFKKIHITRNTETIVPIGIGGLTKIASSGFFMNTFNPGVILTWITMVAAVSSQSSSYRFLVFASCLSLILGLDFLKVFGAHKVRSILTPRNIVYLTRISALCLLGVGIFLLAKVTFDIKIGSF